MKFLKYLVATIAVAVFATAAVAQNARYAEKQRVVYHINYNGETGTSYKSALGNIQNHINAVGAENMDVKVVLHGAGVGLVRTALNDDALQTRIGGLKSQNVKFAICNNTLVNNNIDWENDLYDVWEEDIVPSGVAELSHLQMQGYTYIKP